MNERLTEELTNILREEGSMPRRLSQTELKVLALELAAAMPPVQREDIAAGLCPMIWQMKALLDSVSNDLNSIDRHTPEEQRSRIFSRAVGLIDASITVNNRMGVEAGAW